ncbi:flagellar hook protein FlgE [Lachnospiraceae bacterium]|nr:flagellar hook protein FlgE [Lachnospiraceae bacterium]
MMRSLFSGVAGLKTHQTKMDVIGNNIANVNTVGYKSAQVTFQDLLYQTTQAATGANEATGRAGINAKQIGLGVTNGTIYSNITAGGSTETTGNPFDIMINGNSFFIVTDGSNQFYTRAGAFTVDAKGTLAMTANGYPVMGYRTTTNTAGEIVIDTSSLQTLPINSEDNQTSPADATSKAYFTGILDENSDALSTDNGQSVNVQIYDNEGYTYTVKYKILPAKDTNGDTIKGSYNMTISDIVDSEGDTIFRAQDTANNETDAAYATAKETYFTQLLTSTDADGNSEQAAIDSPVVVTFDNSNGKVSGPYISGQTDVTNSSSGAGFTLNINALATGTGSNGVTGVDLTQLKSKGIAAFTKEIETDISTVKNVDNKGTSTINGSNGGLKTTAGAGWRVGTLSAISIGKDGKVTGSYTNGQTALLGQIATATFSNASGLQKEGENLYSATQNSGDANINTVDANGGSFTTGALEMSNVDLSSEFTSMITTQRGFQANSRIITVSDTLLEELINLKR